jgi:imidazole glycerol-phosphate synthase subunit HisH
MKNREVIIVDYGSGNLLSIMRAVEAVGAKPYLTGDLQKVSNAKHLVVPGVGAFGECMSKIKRKGLVGPLIKSMNRGAFVLGICVGMQILFEESEEFGMHQGLGVIPGKVLSIPSNDSDGRRYKVPHIGWSSLKQPAKNRWGGTILEALEEGCCCYFVHSFMAVPGNETDRLADTYYGNTRICAAVHSGNIYGCQFHPEKSGEIGLGILSGFIKL